LHHPVKNRECKLKGVDLRNRPVLLQNLQSN